MPQTKVILFRAEDGTVPFLDWFGSIPTKAQDKCRVRLERLQQLGHELRRPEADFLRDGIYELRVGLQGVNYRCFNSFMAEKRSSCRTASLKNGSCRRGKLTLR